MSKQLDLPMPSPAIVPAVAEATETRGSPPSRNADITLMDIVHDAKVAVFLHSRADFTMAIEAASPRQVAHFIRDPGLTERRSGRKVVKRFRSLLQVRDNNADVLILTGAAVLTAYQFRNVAHARFILAPAGPAGRLLRTMLTAAEWRGDIRYRGTLLIAGTDWLVFEGSRRRRTSRRFVPVEGGIEGVAAALGGIRYSLLRWHRRLGDLDKLHDLDILVHNDDLHELGERLDTALGFFPIDVRTASRVPGKRGRIYFPPARAFELLDHSIIGRFGERRPTPRDTLLSFSYHLVFQKKIGHLGPGDRLTPETWFKPRIHDELMLLCDEAGVERFASLGDMEAFLTSAGWFPLPDMLSKIARRNAFVQRRYNGRRDHRPGLGLFVLRDAAMRYGVDGAIVDMLRRAGFEIIAEGPVPEHLRATIALTWRGGNWTTPASREPDGGPAYYVIVVDPDPKPLPLRRRLNRRLRSIDNRRLLLKEDIRKQASALAGGIQINAVHSSDNSLEALDYVRTIRPDLYEELSARFRIAPVESSDSKKVIRG